MHEERTRVHAHHLRAGSTLGRYELVRPIASGSEGAVFEAVHRSLGRRVAIKILHARAWEGADAQRAIARFLREGRAAAQVHHPHIVDVFDFAMDEGVPFLVMELIGGGTLARLLSENTRLPLENTLQILLPILSAVAELHAAGIIHRDIKPDNILLVQGNDLCPKLADFGVSHWNDGFPRITRSGTLMGTPDYMPPELLRGRGEATAWADQYSLGIVLYECVTGQRPFQGVTTYDLMHAIVTGKLQPPSSLVRSLPPAFDEVVQRALHHEPEQRFASIDGLAEALLAFAPPVLAGQWRSSFMPPSSRTSESPRGGVRESPLRLVTLTDVQRKTSFAGDSVPARVRRVRPCPALDHAPGIETFDGVGIALHGDVIVSVWNAPARVHRSKWFFDVADRLLRQSAEGILGLMVLLPTAAPPDGPARAENERRLRTLMPSIRSWVTVPIGDEVHQLIVRAVIRMLGLVHGRAGQRFVTGSVDEGIDRLLALAGPATPSADDIGRDVNALFRVLGVGRDDGSSHR